MVVYIDSNASYLVALKARSRVAGYFHLSTNTCTEVPRVFLRYITIILRLWSRAGEYERKNDGGYFTPRLRIGKCVKIALIDNVEEIREKARTAFQYSQK